MHSCFQKVLNPLIKALNTIGHFTQLETKRTMYASLLRVPVLISTCLFSSPLQAEVMTANVEFTVPHNKVIGTDDLFTPLAHHEGKTYLIWVDDQFRPWVTQKINGAVVNAPLDSNSDYKCFPDGHHRYSLGIDRKGYIHVAGDMHNYPGGPDNNKYLPQRYKDQTVMYWISNKPYDVTGGFTFAGGKNASTAIPGYRFTSGHFINDRKGDLYYTSMVKAVHSPSEFGNAYMAVGLYKWSSKTRTWAAIGNVPDIKAASSAVYYKVLLWEKAGGGGWFQNYQPFIHFDHNNGIHFTVAAYADPSLDGITRLMYAFSPDGGRSWQKADGSFIPGLPLRAHSSAPTCADIVMEAKGPFLGADNAVVADANGKPAVYGTKDWPFRYWFNWNSVLGWDNSSQSSSYIEGSRGFFGPDKRLTFIESDAIYIRRTSAFDQRSEGFHLQSYLPSSVVNQVRRFRGISQLGLQTTGSFYGIGNESNNSTPIHVIKVDFTSSPLPEEWKRSEIGTGNVSLGGSTDYDEGVFSLRSYGKGFLDNADELGMTYLNVGGDATITARIVSQDAVRNGATVGVMIRESLDEHAKMAFTGVSYNSGARFVYRNALAAKFVDKLDYGIKSPIWVRLVRAGNVFTAYRSADGNNWTQIGTPQTIAMNANVCVGLASFANDQYRDHQTVVDNVSIVQ
jgi:hypothetical protein